MLLLQLTSLVQPNNVRTINQIGMLFEPNRTQQFSFRWKMLMRTPRSLLKRPQTELTVGPLYYVASTIGPLADQLSRPMPKGPLHRPTEGLKVSAYSTHRKNRSCLFCISLVSGPRFHFDGKNRPTVKRIIGHFCLWLFRRRFLSQKGGNPVKCFYLHHFLPPKFL